MNADVDRDAARARLVAVSAVSAAHDRHAERLLQTVPPSQRDQLRARLADTTTAQTVFAPAGWRGRFLADWDGDRSSSMVTVTRRAPDVIAVTLAETADGVVIARVVRAGAGSGDDDWYFQGLALEKR